MKRCDLHTHTTMSDGSVTPEALLAAAKEKGYGLGITDHAFCCNMYTLEDVSHYLERLRPLEVLRGLEGNMGEDYSLPGSLDRQVDYVIASVHAMPGPRRERYQLGNYFCFVSGLSREESISYSEALFDDYAACTLKMVEDTFRTQRADIYGHPLVVPFYSKRKGTLAAEAFEDAVVSLCQKYHVALEISGLWDASTPRMIRRAKAAGVRFTLGSDCHLAKDACNLDRAIALADACGLTEDDFFLPKRNG